MPLPSTPIVLDFGVVDAAQVQRATCLLDTLAKQIQKRYVLKLESKIRSIFPLQDESFPPPGFEAEWLNVFKHELYDDRVPTTSVLDFYQYAFQHRAYYRNCVTRDDVRAIQFMLSTMQLLATIDADLVSQSGYFTSQSGEGVIGLAKKICRGESIPVGIDAPTSDLLSRLTDVLERFSSSIDTVVTGASGITQMEPARLMLICGLTMVILTSTIRYTLFQTALDAGLAAAAFGALTLTASSDLRDWLSSNVGDFCKHFQSAESQTPMSSQSFSLNLLLHEAITALTGTFSFLSIGQAPPKAMLSRVLGSISGYGRLRTGFESLIMDVISTVELIVNLLREHVCGLDPIKLVKTYSPEVEEWLDAITKISALQGKGEYPLNIPNGRRVNSLVQQGQGLLVKLRGLKDEKLFGLITKYLEILARVEKPFAAMNYAGQASRIAPVVVQFQGESGVGKSRLIEPFVVSVLARILPPDCLDSFEKCHDNFVYTRNKEQDFWDGYFSQFAVIYDDFCQARSSLTDGNSEAMEIIRTSNTFAFPLHMAGLESKGKTNFNSHLLVLTTNMSEMKAEGISSQEALIRRIGINVRVCPKLQYCTPETRVAKVNVRRLDVSKAGQGFNPDIYEFHELVLLHGGMPPYGFTMEEDKSGYFTGKIWSFQEMIDMTVTTYEKHISAHESFSTHVKDVKAAALEKRREKAYETAVEKEDDGIPELFDSDNEDDPHTPEERALLGIKMKSQSGDFGILRRKPTREDIEEWVDESPRAYPHFSPEVTRVMRDLDSPVCARVMHAFAEAGIHNFTVARLLVENEAVNEWFKHITDVNELCRFLVEKLYPDPDVLPMLQAMQAITWGPEQILDTSIGAQIKEYWNNLRYNFMRRLDEYPILKWLIGGVSIIGAAVAMWRLFRPTPEEDPLPDVFDLEPDEAAGLWSQSADNGSPGQHKKNKRSGRNNKRRIAHAKLDYNALYADDDWQTHSGNDPNGEQIIAKVNNSSVYEMSIPVGDSVTRLGFITFTRGQTCAMPLHFRRLIAHHVGNKILTLETKIRILHIMLSAPSLDMTVGEFLELQYVEDNDNDILWVEFPRTTKCHPNITSYFVNAAKINSSRDFAVRLIIPDMKNRFLKLSFTPDAHVTHNRSLSNDSGIVHLVRGFEYDSLTGPGDCGSMLHIVDATTRGAKIIGIHVGGNPGKARGISNCITREMVEAAYDSLHPTIPMETQGGEFLSDLGFKVLRTIAPYPSTPGTSTIIPSALFGKWGPAQTAPALLTPKEVDGKMLDPMKNAVSKYTKEFKKIPDKIMEAAIDNYCSLLNNHNPQKKTEPRIYDFRTAILGDPDDPHFNALPRNTSAGYPDNVNTRTGEGGKHKYFGYDTEYDLDRKECKQLEIEIAELYSEIRRGIRREHIYTDVLKDERRPLAKVATAMSRLVSCAPMRLTILTRMMFGSFTAHIMRNCISNGVAVGVNPFSFDWERLVRYLKEHGNYIIAGDYSAHDASLSPQMLEAVLVVIEKFYHNSTEEDRLARATLYKEITDSLHVNQGLLYQWTGALPSGTALTTMINSIANQINVRVAWIIAHGNDIASVVNFNRCVRLVTFGDDNIMGVNKEAHETFNPITLAEGLEKIGMKYTSEDKQAQVAEFKKLEEATFLKRGFRHEKLQDRHVAPLDIDVIKEMSYWTRRGSKSLKITRENLENAIGELALHGEEVFSQWEPVMNRAARKFMKFSSKSSIWSINLATALGRDFNF